ncbi:MAG: MBOAT family protein [Clostridiales bacterium]|nr:MBOAT family protein [Clostridiales bacterium]
MLFNSYIFILLFLPLTVCGYYLLGKTKRYNLPKLFLLGMSLWFYAYFNIKYLYIIVISILFNYLLYILFFKIRGPKVRKTLLIIGIIANISVLFNYKYLGFCTENVNLLLRTDFVVKHLVLPLGISFFTFQQFSFVVDSYKGLVPRYSFPEYALFVVFFPQLIAGPIVLHDEIIPQFQNENRFRFSSENFSKAIFAFAYGLAKKVLIADTFGNLANIGFEKIAYLDSTNAILAVLSYTIQIYFDFSGYCDMAVGLGLMFNIHIPQNFNSPYKSLDMNEFWQRWHISLTRFFRTNLYFPLGGNRKGAVRTYVNYFIVFLASGIWHGANWTFFLWGALNGILVIISKLFSDKISYVKKKAPFVMWILTFICTNLLWVYFRSDSIADANRLLTRIFSCNFGAIRSDFIDVFQTAEFSCVSWIISKFSESAAQTYTLVLLVLCFAFAVFASVKMKNLNERLETFKPDFKTWSFSVIAVIWSLISLSGVSTFLYFNF